MIDVGGYRLEILCEGRGSPTVVFENGEMPFVDVFTSFKEEAIDPRLRAYQLGVPGILDDPEKAALIAKMPEPYRLEYDTWSEDARKIIAAGVLPDIPIIVLTAGSAEQVASSKPPWDDYALWWRSHADLAASILRGRHVMVEDAGHMIFEKNPAAVLEAIARAVSEN